MYCPHRKDGCEWIGQLGDYESHRTSQNGCDYERVQCPNKCTYSTWGIDKYLCRKDVKNHVAWECVRRWYLCEHCFRVDTYDVITKQHYSECPEHPISCPNLGCSATGIKRKELPQRKESFATEKISILRSVYSFAIGNIFVGYPTNS